MTRNLLRAAQRQGWRVERTNGGHYRWRSPDRSVPQIISGGTPSCHRAERNLLAQLRRGGLAF